MRLFYPSARVSLAIVSDLGELPSFGEDDGGLLKLTDIKPVSCSMESNDLHTADTFKITLEESVFPVDPRMIHTVAVAVFMGDAGRMDETLDTGQGQEMLLGVIDEIEKDFSREDKDTVTLSGRDYSTLLIDTEWGNDVYVDLEGPISSIVDTVIKTVPATRLLRVESLYETDPEFPGGPPSVSRFIAKSGASVWEGLSEIAARVGAIITVRGDRVVIQPPRTARAEDAMPLFVHGRNVDSLSVKREYGRHTTPNVVVRARDPETFETVVGRYPEEPTESTSAGKSGGQTKTSTSQKTTTFTIRHPVPTPKILSEIAKQVHARQAEQQLQVSFSTKEMRVWNVPRKVLDNDDLDLGEASFDVTRLKNGDSVRIHIDRRTRNVLQKGITEEQKARLLHQEGFAEDVARELARGWRRIDTPMFVKSASHAVAEGGKYSLDVECENRITVDI